MLRAQTWLDQLQAFISTPQRATHQCVWLPWGETEMCCVRRGTVPCVPAVCWNLSINLMGFGLGPEFSAVPAKWTPQASSALVLEWRPFGDPTVQEVPAVLWQQSSHPGVSRAPSLPLGHSVHHLHTWLHTCICHPLSQARHAPLPPPAQITNFFHPVRPKYCR